MATDASNEPCIGTKDNSCVEVCPSGLLHPTPDEPGYDSAEQLYKADAGTRAAGFALLAVIGRPTGGWLSDRVGAARVLHVSFVAVGGLALALARRWCR